MGWILQPVQCIVERLGGAIMLETLRPDPTFYPSQKLAMQAPPENYAYVLMLSPDASQPDALGVVDVRANSSTYATLVHTAHRRDAEQASRTAYFSQKCLLTSAWTSSSESPRS